MKWPISFIIEGHPIAGGFIRDGWIHNERQAPVSYAFFCPECGDIWAKAIVPDRDFMVRTVDCPKHPAPNPFYVPGSIWLPWDVEYTLSLPREVLQRELELHLNHYERFHP